jgi:DNA-binding MarR family transcriptional regulator
MTMPTPYDPERSIGALAKDISKLLTRNFDTRVREFGLTHAQWQALAALARCEGIKQVQLADLLQIQPISLARLIDRMETAGWVERRPDPNDRRAVLLYLTPRVQPILEQMKTAALAAREDALADFDARERDQLVAMLHRLRSNLWRAESAADGTPARSGAGRSLR